MAKRTSTELTVSPEYMAYALKHMEIDMDDYGLFCIVPSQQNVHAPEPYNEQKHHIVCVDESMLVPVATECDCNAYEHYRRCRHIIVINTFYKRIYKSNLEKVEKKREAKLMDMPLNGARAFKLVG